MDADKLEAGRELDELVVKAMGWHISSWADETDGGYQLLDGDGKYKAKWDAPEGFKHELEPRHRWSSSIDIAAAWEARTKIVDSTGAVMELTDYGGPKDDFERYCCVFVKERPKSAGLTEWGAEGWANTAPLAISRAALKAVQNER